MRKYCACFSFLLFFEVPGLYAQGNSLKVCVTQYDEGYDALQLA
jgi:hypothetical protein